MANRETVLQAWRKYCVQFTSAAIDDKKVIFSEEVTGSSGPRPGKPFITLKLLSGPSPKPSFDNLRFEGDKPAPALDLWSSGGQRQGVVSIQAFGLGSEDELASIQNFLDTFDGIQFFKNDGDIAIVSKGTILDISALVEVGFERRHVLDITFNHSSNVTSEAGAIEKTSISGKLKGIDGKEIIVDEFEVEEPTP